MPWISKLRVKDNSEIARLYSKKGIEQTTPLPPSFYESDIQKKNGNF